MSLDFSSRARLSCWNLSMARPQTDDTSRHAFRFRSNFVEDLGEDFFGTRELGLDASSMAVPSRLFRGKEEEYRLTNG